jgi:hypothetical protein
MTATALLTPFYETGEHHYAQLFEPSKPRSLKDVIHVVTGLGHLVSRMTDDGTRVCKEEKVERAIDAGYTYFGQFVDHNLTDDQSGVGDVWAFKLRPQDILNVRSPRLDLGQLYGRGPWDATDKQLYEPRGVKLKVGAKIQSTLDPSAPPRSFDIAVEKKKFLVADQRAGENIILRQITAVFARLHNQAVKQFSKSAGSLRELFERARLHTTWQFQHLVCADYLQQVLDPTVYASLFVPQRPGQLGTPMQPGTSLIRWKSFSIPAEFSAAAMRFGHSMVRNSYRLRTDGAALNLSQLLKVGRSRRALPAELEIEWARFFTVSGGGTGPVAARPIDTRISDGLHQLPPQVLRLFNTGTVGLPPFIPIPQLALPLITLLRGLGLRLASGQQVAAAFGHPVLTTELALDCRGNRTPQGEILEQFGLTTDTPLWYYILKESEMQKDGSEFLNGNYLGATGSRLVGETIHAALMTDPLSIWRHPDTTAAGDFPDWDIGGRTRKLDNLGMLFGVAPQLE